MSTHTLLLTPWMHPHRLVDMNTAIILHVLGKIDVLESYDEIVSSPSVSFQVPAVARLKRPVGAYKRGVKFSRINVMTRDHFSCQYCGVKLGMRQLNYDHVIPKVRGGKTDFENIVASCYPCNDRKAGRTPKEAGMKLLRKPFRPITLPMGNPLMGMREVPDLWKPYVRPELLDRTG